MKEKTISSFKVTMIPPATPTRPIDGRTYRLHYTENREEWNLIIGNGNECGEKNEFTNGSQYKAKWSFHRGRYILLVSIQNLPKSNRAQTVKSLPKEVFRFLQGIVRGDETFFQHFPWVWDAPIYVTYGQSGQNFMETEQFGTPRHFIYYPQEESLVRS